MTSVQQYVWCKGQTIIEIGAGIASLGPFVFDEIVSVERKKLLWNE